MCGRSRATSLRVIPIGSSSRPKPGIKAFVVAHVLFGKPAPPFPGHALAGAMSVRCRTSIGRMAAVAWLLGAATATAQSVDPLNIPDTQLEPVKWSDLDGWVADDHGAAFAVFRVSCEP